MSRIAVMSDPHGNLEALERVFDDVDAHGVDEVFCLGDVVGYGPQPQECCDLLRGRKARVILGNHEQGLINIHHLCTFNQPACDALRKTREMLSEDAYEWLTSHPKAVVAHGCRFVHGTPPDLVKEYLWKHETDMASVFAGYPEDVCFVGHTHDLMRFTWADGQAVKRDLPEGETQLEEGSRHIVNVGAVGQPRDGDNRAKWALYDTKIQSVAMRFIAYDIQKTDELIRRRGFHGGFADRLW